MVEASKKIFYENQAKSIINKLEARKMEGYYTENTEKAIKKVLELVGEKSKVIGFGGSMTINESGLKTVLTDAGHQLLDQSAPKNDEELRQLKSKMINADFFMMSTNAITTDGELINIDGRGNRVNYMIYGPENVIIIAGMNKVVPNIDDGIRRIHSVAAPANTVRLGIDTPCSKTGICANCITNTICCQTVITRVSRVPGRIKVILVGEDLGY